MSCYWFVHQNNPVGKTAEAAAQLLLAKSNEIESLVNGYYNLIVRVGNLSFDLWNTNRPYAQYSQGHVRFVGNDGTDTIIMSWKDERPENKTMSKIDDLIKNFDYGKSKLQERIKNLEEKEHSKKKSGK